MDDEVRSALIEASGKFIVPVMREVIVREYDMRSVERRNQQEIDLLRKKQEVMSEQPTQIESGDTGETPAPDPQPVEHPERAEAAPEPAETTAEDEVSEAIEEMKAKEDCPICASLLDGLRDLPPKQRIQGMSEYGHFKSFASDPDVTEDELVAKIEEMPVLRQVIEEEVGPAAMPDEEAEPAEAPA